MGFAVRKATKSDIPAIFQMVKELNEFENLNHGKHLTLEGFYRDAGFDDSNSSPLFYCLVAEEIDSNDCSKRNTIGYSLYFHTYSTWQGKVMYLEDIYVKSNYRKKGIGKLLLVELAKEARDTNCKRIELHALENNPAQEFYKGFGGKNLSDIEGWHLYRFDNKALDGLAALLKK